jgi:hypothetical protein
MLTSCAAIWFPTTAAAQGPEFQVDEHGVVAGVHWPGGPTISQVVLLVPNLGWNGQLFAQDAWKPETFEHAAGANSWRVAGRAQWDKGALSVEETISLEGRRLILAYRLRFEAAAESEGVRLLLRVPTDQLGGAGRLIRGRDGLGIARALPKDFAQPRHLAGASEPSWFAWQLGEGLAVVRPIQGQIADLMVQDCREWQNPYFEAHLTMAVARTIKAADEFAFKVALEPDSAADLGKRGVKIVEAENRWDTAKVELASAGDPGIGDVHWSAQEGPRWRPVEVSFPVTGTWDNPFDPARISVEALIEGPDRNVLRQPAFLYQDFAPLAKTSSSLVPRGGLEWRLRWTPSQEGAYRVRLVAESGGQRVARVAGAFTCRGSSGHGFVRRCPDTPYYLRFDDGAPYFAVGENICWDGEDLVEAYGKWFKALGQAGGNYCRIWLVRWNMGLEWSPADGARRGCFYGLGRYSLDNAWRLDRVLELARQNGIYVMLCLGYHGELQDQKDYFGSQCWDQSPYNTAQGGPCATPADFWVNEDARRLYKQRLRYYLARWGADPNVLSFEFWNEVNAPAPWVSEMATYLGENDIHAHLRTTTYGGDATWNLAGMDYSQNHHYGSDEDCPDAAPIIYSTSMDWTEKYRKPFMMGEFGIDWKTSDTAHDPKGIGTNMHNGLWAAVAGRSFGAAALWYWDGYVDPLSMYPQFTSVASFASLVDWTRFKPARVEADPLRYVRPPDKREFADVTIVPADDWRKQADVEAVVGPDGNLVGTRPSAFLFSRGKPDVGSPMRGRFTTEAAGRARVVVGRVSALATLSVVLDGQEVLRQEYKCGPPGEGRYKKSEWLEQWKLWQSTFDEEVAFDVPEGEHMLELSCADGDWMTVAKVVLPGVRDMALPQVDAWLLADDGLAIGWLHDRESIWWSDRDGKTLKEHAPMRLIFRGLRDGSYRALWYDTWAGKPGQAEEVRVEGGRLELATPPFKRDIALIVKPPE